MTLVINLNPVETSYSTARCISVYATKLMTLVIKVLPETSSRTARCIAVNAASLMTLVIKTNMFSVIKVTVVTKGTDVPVKSGHLWHLLPFQKCKKEHYPALNLLGNWLIYIYILFLFFVLWHLCHLSPPKLRIWKFSHILNFSRSFSPLRHRNLRNLRKGGTFVTNVTIHLQPSVYGVYIVTLTKNQKVTNVTIS